MTKIVMTKRGGVLISADSDAREVLDKIKDGANVMVEVRQSRNPRFHRLYFALLNLVVENCDAFENIEQALTAIKIAIGECDPFIDQKTGKTFWVTRSISFEKCDETRFHRIFERSIHAIITRWLTGNTTEELRQRVLEIVDGDARSSLGRRVA